MITSLPYLRWLLLALLSLWTVALVIFAFALMVDSYGGMGPVPLVIAGGNLFAALPFLTPMGSGMVNLARVVAVAQGVGVIATGYLLEGMGNAIVSMGNSKDPAWSPLFIVAVVMGSAIVLLAILAPTCRPAL